MYLFSIPDSLCVRTVNKVLLLAMQEHSQWFFDDFLIETAYGCPGGCIWNGNRIEGDLTYLGNWQKVIETYSGFKVSYRLTFTNFLLRPEHLYDTYANKIAEMLNQRTGYVMVSMPLMANYMQRYSNLKVCWSTTTDFGKGQEEIIDKINELSENDLVVLPYEFNNKPELDRFNHPENLEVLVNEYCIDNCPRRREHWTECNELALLQRFKGGECFFGNLYSKEMRSHNLTRAMLADYAAKGITHFKISGRLDVKQTSLAYYDFFIRPEFYQDVTDYFFEQNRTNFGKGWDR